MTATITLRRTQTFPAGTEVSAYKLSNWHFHQLPPSGSPLGSADDTATVAADGTIDFTGLQGESYLAHAEVDGEDRYVSFLIENTAPPSPLGEHEAQTTEVHGIENTANVPSTAEKAALVGSSGTPGSTNKFVTHADPRNSNTRTPTDGTVTAAKLASGTPVADSKIAWASPPAYTQTYSTAVRTQSAGALNTALSLTLVSELVTALNATNTAVNELKQFANGIVDDLQARGIFS